jgi:4-hydroxybenzoate polyprenyltransferase
MPSVLRAIRIHQWRKNLLVFIPAVSSQHYDRASLLTACAAFFAFSFAASAVYVFNDLRPG